MLSHNINYFKAKPVNIPKITILVDHGYHPETISQALKFSSQILTKIRFERSPKTFKAEKLAGKSGFVAVANGWLNARMLDGTLQVPGQNFEWTLDHARAKLNLCFIRLMLKRLAEAKRYQMGSIIFDHSPLT